MMYAYGDALLVLALIVLGCIVAAASKFYDMRRKPPVPAYRALPDDTDSVDSGDELAGLRNCNPFFSEGTRRTMPLFDASEWPPLSTKRKLIGLYLDDEDESKAVAEHILRSKRGK